MATWEPKIAPPHPSTVSELSVNAQKVLAAIERNWEAAFIRNKPTIVGRLAERSPACNYNYRPTPNHYQQNYAARRGSGGLPPPISPSVAYGSQSQASYPPSQAHQDGIFNRPQQSRTGVARQQHNPMLRHFNLPSQDSAAMSKSQAFSANIQPRYGVQVSPGPFNTLNKGPFALHQPRALPYLMEPRQAMKPPQCLPNSSRILPNDPWISQSASQPLADISQSLLLSSQVAQQISQIKNPNHRVESPGMEFGSDDEGQDWTQSLTQRNVLCPQFEEPKTPEAPLQISQIKNPNHRIESPGMEFGSDDEGLDWTQSLTQRNVLCPQFEEPKTPEVPPQPDKHQEDIIEIIDTQVSDSQNNIMLSELNYCEFQKEDAVSMETDKTLKMVFDPILQEEAPILSEINKPTSPVVLQSMIDLDSPIKLTPLASTIAQEFKMTPEKTSSTAAGIFQMTSESSTKLQKQQLHDNNIKHKKTESTKNNNSTGLQLQTAKYKQKMHGSTSENNNSTGLQLQTAKYKQKMHGSTSEARTKLIESVLKPKSPEKRTPQDRPLKETKRTLHAEPREDIATSSGVKKKKKFQTPFISQQSQTQASNTKCQPKTQTPKHKENIKITTLMYEEIKKLRRQIQSTPPIEICITMMYKEGFCQLSKTSEDVKKNSTCSPNGLMLAILSENDPVKFYLLPIDGNNEGRASFSEEKSLVKNIILAPCRKVCFKSQELFVYLSHTFNFKYHEVSLQWIAIDPLVGCWLLNSDEPPIFFNQVLTQLGLNKKQEQSSQLQVQTCKNLVFLSQAVETMYQKLVERELWRVFLDLESKITSVLTVMEIEGIPVDKKILKEIGNNLEAQIRQLQSKANKLMGFPVLLTSPQQLRRILYEQLKLDSKIKIPLTLQGGGKSTSESTLKLLEHLHPLPGLILEFRHLQKLNSTYIDGILQYVSEGKVFTTWEQTVAATGRIISRDPNVQAIPKQAVYLTDEGDTKKEIELRSAFKCIDGHSFLAADFQHIELRLLAHFAQDPALSAMFVQTQQDVFQLLARQWLGLSTSREVTYEEREKTKRVVYAVMYGAGVLKLEQVLQVDSEEARNILSSFTAKFPQIRNFSKKLIWKARDQGYITSLSGRRRQFPNITSCDMKLRSQSERQAVNFLIQGSAADVCKVAMLATEQAQQEHSPPLNARLLLQIHDELVWQVPDSQLEQFTDVVQKAMEGTRNHFKISLPLPVAIGSGKTWADLH